MVRFSFLSPSFLLFSSIVFLSACSGSSSNSSDTQPIETPVTVTGSVLNYQDGTPINNAQIQLHYGSQTVNVSSNSSGQFSLASFETAERIVLNADAEGFSEHAVIISSNESLADQLVIRLQPNDLNIEFDASEQRDFSINNQTILQLPANALVDASGNAFTGMAKVEIKIIDPALDAAIMPGDYRVQPEGDTADILESFGALAVRFSSGSEALNLAEGQEATIRIPVSSLYFSSTIPSTMPLYYFDESTGYWVEEGSANLEADSDTGQQFYVGQVSHFSVWNADQPLSTVNLTGCVRDDTDNLVSNARVYAEGINYIGSSLVYTGSDGCFSLPVRMESLLVLYFSANGQSFVIEWDSSNLNVGTINLAPSEFSAKLTWGSQPEDLDAHFITPAGEVYYSNLAVVEDGFNASLDVDDTDSFGPEIISGTAFTLPGCYEFYVHNFSNEKSWDQTGAKVVVDLQGEQRQFLANQIPASRAELDNFNKVWQIFTAEVDENLNVTINYANQLIDQTTCTSEIIEFPGMPDLGEGSFELIDLIPNSGSVFIESGSRFEMAAGDLVSMRAAQSASPSLNLVELKLPKAALRSRP